jgi:hypothetical protein
MRRLRDSILGLLIHLTILFNIERFDFDGTNVINLETALYALTVVAIIMILSIKWFRSLSQPVLLALWSTAYVAMKLVLIERRPLIGDMYTYLSFTELGLLLIGVLLAQRIALNIEEFEQALKNFAFANISKVRRVNEAQDEIQAEIYRSRRFQRPLSLVVLEQDANKVQTNINKIVQDAQRSLMEHYISVMMARELSVQLRQTDILLEHDKKGRLIIVSSDTDHSGIEAFINRLKSLSRTGLFSVNFGTATFPIHAVTFDQLLEHAEGNLQQQQAENQVSMEAAIDSKKEVNVG